VPAAADVCLVVRTIELYVCSQSVPTDTPLCHW